jgi:predicted transcriptional regulator
MILTIIIDDKSGDRLHRLAEKMEVEKDFDDDVIVQQALAAYEKLIDMKLSCPHRRSIPVERLFK